MSDSNSTKRTPSPRADLPPFEEDAGGKGGFKAIAQLFLVPALIVVAAAGVFLAMNFLVGGEAGPEELLEQAASGDSRRRGQAAFELSKLISRNPELVDDVAFRARLLATYEHSKGGGEELRRYLTRVLSLIEIPEATSALIEATSDADPHTRLYAAVALGNAKSAAAVPRLIELSRDDDSGLRIVAINSLAVIGDASALEPLRARLNDPQPDVTWNAASALAYMGDGGGEAILRRMLGAGYLESNAGIEPAQIVQAMIMAVEALGRLESRAGDEDRRRILEDTAKGAPFPAVQEAALRALEQE